MIDKFDNALTILGKAAEAIALIADAGMKVMALFKD